MSRLVAASTRTSTLRVCELPTGSNSPSCKTRSSFDLQIERQLADFVEKNRAAMRQSEASLALFSRAGKSALFVAEQFALDQRRRDRRAVDFDQRSIAPPAGCDE